MVKEGAEKPARAQEVRMQCSKSSASSRVRWPDGKRFAFTVFDDTDLSSVANTSLVYGLLSDLGLRTTKSVWPLRGSDVPSIGGSTCEDPEYWEWIQQLQAKGFEIGFHNASYHSSAREFTERGLRRFLELIGHEPKTMANHADCKEGIYWGEARLTGVRRLLYKVLTRHRRTGYFRGHVEGDPYFWGDLCQTHVKYVRNFVFSDINTLNECPAMPYHDPARPYVNYWYASSEGPTVKPFCECIAEQNQDRLEEQGGACIMYTHFACGFQEGRSVNRRFQELMKRLAGRNGWFVPVGVLLDFLLERKSSALISEQERTRLERKWLWRKILLGTS